MKARSTPPRAGFLLNQCYDGCIGAYPMSKEQLDAVKEQLWSEDNDGLRQSVFCAYLEAPERGANMIIAFANNKGLKLDATADEVVE